MLNIKSRKKLMIPVAVVLLLVMMTGSALAANRDWSGFTTTYKGNASTYRTFAIQNALENGYTFYNPWVTTCTTDPARILEAAGGMDGSFGNGTKNAVKDFQSKENLYVDGIVGNNTWKELRIEAAVTRAYDSTWEYSAINTDEDPVLTFRYHLASKYWQTRNNNWEWRTFQY